jgi:cysteine/O-acetylserine efflux protein
MSFIPFLSYVIVTTFTPGPNNIMAMSNASRMGLRRSVPFILGVGAGFLVIMLLSSYFNLVLYHFIPRIKVGMNILGCLYMLYLAVKVVRSNSQRRNDSASNNNSFFSGLLLQFINPKVILYGITVISTFITPYHYSNFTLVAYSVFLAFVGFVGTFSWALCGSLFQSFLLKYQKAFNIVMALLLVYSALSVFG